MKVRETATHGALRIAEVPRQSIAMPVKMATGARDVAVGREAGVIEEASSVADRVRLRIETNRSGCNLRPTGKIDDADRFIKSVQYVKQIARFIQSQSRRSLAHLNP